MGKYKELSRFENGVLLLIYLEDEQGHTGMLAVPAGTQDRLQEKDCRVESLVQFHIRGEPLPHGFGNGLTLCDTGAVEALRFYSQKKEGDTVVTELRDERGLCLVHRARMEAGCRALRITTEMINGTGGDITVDLLSSFSMGMMTPYARDEAPGRLKLHRVRSFWSAEGRMDSRSIEELGLEPAWLRFAVRTLHFGQNGSMPVRGWFPFAAVEDTGAGVTWAFQLAVPGSWQMEVHRRDAALCVTGGLADGESGHWEKKLVPGQRFVTPEAYVTVCEGGPDDACIRLSDLWRSNQIRPERKLPVMFNEYCTTWGNPTAENLHRITEALKGHGVDILVIDAGWYRQPEKGWSDCGGDWIPNEKELFPCGLKATAEEIRAAGMIPGLWFEPETCAPGSDLYQREELLLTRDGRPVDTENRRFLDMRKAETQAYLSERVARLLRKNGFGYIKIDYNDSIGIGCDGAESLGEGLRQALEGTQRFFRSLREQVPGLMIENCSSGGHRLEPSMMALCDMASFSDAHECAHIPVIAAALHRMILPAQSQIWAVLRKTDSIRRLNYSLVNTLLGVMCLSGDIFDLNAEQWAKVDEAIAFYRAAERVIREGESRIHDHTGVSWLHPSGWQAVTRTAKDGETLTVIHAFEGGHPDSVSLNVPGGRIMSVLCSENNTVTLGDGVLTVSLREDMQAVAVLTAP